VHASSSRRSANGTPTAATVTAAAMLRISSFSPLARQIDTN